MYRRRGKTWARKHNQYIKKETQGFPSRLEGFSLEEAKLLNHQNAPKHTKDFHLAWKDLAYEQQANTSAWKTQKHEKNNPKGFDLASTGKPQKNTKKSHPRVSKHKKQPKGFHLAWKGSAVASQRPPGSLAPAPPKNQSWEADLATWETV